jgi:hypothetical protein
MDRIEGEMQNFGTGTDPYQTAPEVGMKLARERLNHRVGKVSKPLCLACGQPATNQLPSCSDPKCIKAVRPVDRWARRVAALTTTKGYKKAA